MSNKEKIPGTAEAWESGQLGDDEKYVKAVDGDLIRQVDDSLGLQMISIRLEKGLIDSFRMLGGFHGVGYQPLMRDALKRFADAEMKAIVSGLVESQKQTKPHPKKSVITDDIEHQEKKAA